MATQSKSGSIFPSKNIQRIDYKTLSKKELLVIYNYLEEFFGISKKHFKGFTFIKRGKDAWICSEKSLQTIAFSSLGLKINTIGIRSIRSAFESNKKLTTNFIQIFGKHATKGTFELSQEHILPYARGEDLDIPEIGRGYKIVTYKKHIIGMGSAQDNILVNQIPKSRFIKNWNITAI